MPGHANIAITLNIYWQVTRDMQEAGAAVGTARVVTTRNRWQTKDSARGAESLDSKAWC